MIGSAVENQTSIKLTEGVLRLVILVQLSTFFKIYIADHLFV